MVGADVGVGAGAGAGVEVGVVDGWGGGTRGAGEEEMSTEP